MDTLNKFYFLAGLLASVLTAHAFSYVPPHLAAPTTSRSACEAAALTLFNPSEAWIRQHMRFGFERTFSSEVLDGLLDGENLGMKLDLLPEKGLKVEGDLQHTFGLAAFIEEQLSKYSTITAEQAAEVTRFFIEVLGARDVEFFLHFPEERFAKEGAAIVEQLGFEPHLQSFSFFLRDREGRALWVTLEPGCIEVNQAPVALDQIEVVWNEIEDRAAKSGFVGTIHEGGNGGGATHLHWGWDQSANNLWAIRSDLSARVMMLPLKLRSLLYIFGQTHDHGDGSNSRLPWEIPDEDLGEYLNYVYSLTQLAVSPMTEGQRREWIQKNEHSHAAEHDRAISLKRFGEKDPRFELRFIRTLASKREMALVAEFWARLLIDLIQRPDFMVVEPRIFYRTQDWSLVDMRDQATELFEKLRFSESEIAELLSLGGWPVGQSSSITLRSLDSRFGEVTYLYGPKTENGFERVELRVPISKWTHGAVYLSEKSPDQVMKSRRGDSWIVRLRCVDFQVLSGVIIFLDDTGQTSRIVATCDASDPNHYVLTFGESLTAAMERPEFGDEFAPPTFFWNLLGDASRASLEARAAITEGGSPGEISEADKSKLKFMKFLDTDAEKLRLLALRQSEKPLDKLWLLLPEEIGEVKQIFINSKSVPFKVQPSPRFKTFEFKNLAEMLGDAAYKDKISFVISLRILRKRVRIRIKLDRRKNIYAYDLLPQRRRKPKKVDASVESKLESQSTDSEDR